MVFLGIRSRTGASIGGELAAPEFTDGEHKALGNISFSPNSSQVKFRSHSNVILGISAHAIWIILD